MTSEDCIQARIKQAREKARLSQEAVAVKMSIRQQTIYRWEQGEGINKFEYVRDFIMATNCDPYWLLGLEKGK